MEHIIKPNTDGTDHADGTDRVVLAVSELLDILERCDSTSFQAVCLIRHGESSEHSICALRLICSLPRDSLEQPCLDECSALVRTSHTLTSLNATFFVVLRTSDT